MKRRKKRGIKLRVARNSTLLRADINKCVRQWKERANKSKTLNKNRNPALTLFHQQGGHSHQHSPVQRVLHVSRWILALTFSAVVVVGKYSPRLSKILKSASSLSLFLFFSIFFFFLTPRSDWLADWRFQHPPTLCAVKVPPSAAREASRRCARQASGTEGDCVSGLLSSRHLSCNYFEETQLPAVSGFRHKKLNAAIGGSGPWRCCCLLFASDSQLEIK